MRVLVFGIADACGQAGLRQLFRARLVPRFGGGQIAQQFARRRVGGALCGAGIEGMRLMLHRAGFGPYPIKSEILDQPDRAAGIKARDVFAADQGDDIAETRGVQVDQATAMLALLLGHGVEDGGTVGIFGPQAFGIEPIDAGVIFLGRNRQSQNFLFGEVAEATAI